MAYAWHCDREGCDSWQKVDGDFPPFLELLEGEGLLGNFCSLNCLTMWAAGASEPTETIEM